MGKQGFAHTGKVFDEQVTPGKQASQREFYRIFFSEQYPIKRSDERFYLIFHLRRGCVTRRPFDRS